MKSSIFPWLLGALVVALGAAQANSAPLQASAAELRQVPRELRLDGVVEATQRTTVSAQTSGQVEEIRYDVDDYVENGAVLMVLKDAEHRARVERATADLPNRLKLATASAVQDELEALAHQLDRIDAEMPVAGLVGRLALGVADALPREPTGAHVIVGQIAFPPADNTWLVGDRARIAAICRYLVEASHARSEGRLDLAESIEAFVNDAAARGR